MPALALRAFGDFAWRTVNTAFETRVALAAATTFGDFLALARFCQIADDFAGIDVLYDGPHGNHYLEIITRGVVHVDASAEILEELRELLVEKLDSSTPETLTDIENVQDMLRAVLKRFFRKRLGRRPMILPVVWEM